MSSSKSIGIPSIKTFQVDSSGIGNLKKSVNLFRGDINFTQNLISIPGSSGKKELDVNISILYQSNIEQEASKWNLDAPTGIVGLGWDLPLERIILDNNNSPTKETNTYYYESGGSTNLLIRELSNPFLLNLDIKNKDYLTITTESKLHPTLYNTLITSGIDVDSNAVILNNNENTWTISDNVLQRLYTIKNEENVLNLYDGGDSYQLQSYQFWKILYYPEYERWEITEESGTHYSFGGISTESSTTENSTGNSIEWSVCWSKKNDDGTETALWSGNSSLTTVNNNKVQNQFASAWNLNKIQDIWGEEITYAYNETEEVGTLSTGLTSSDFQQQVGNADGLFYTKACYLTSITDVYKRKIVFEYKDKIYDSSSDDAPKEYQDPHKIIPDSTPNSYQDQYETKYLKQISVLNSNIELLFYLVLEYCPRPSLDSPYCEVANITSYTDKEFGNTFKRYLTSVTQYNADGDSLPGLNFDYYLDDDTERSNLGALKSITYPEGGTATYSYSLHNLDICNRKEIITPPVEVSHNSSDAVPRVWFGDDYVVSIWYNYNSGEVSMRVFTWLGHWECWQLNSKDSIIAQSTSIDISTMNVVAQSNFFSLSFGQGSETHLYIFQKDTAKSGQWLQPASLENCNPMVYDCESSFLTFTGGDSFILIQRKNIDGSSLNCLTFNWSTQDWTSETIIENSRDCLFVTAYSEYFATLVLHDNNAIVTLNYLDPQLNWHQKEPFQIDDFNLANEDSFVMSPSQSFIACSRLRSIDTSITIDYSISILQWDEDYNIFCALDQRFQDDVSDQGAATTYSPQVISNSLVCCAGHLMRFNGNEWLINSELTISNPDNYIEQRYSYGDDYTLQSIYQEPTSSGKAKLLQFDPDKHSLSWNENTLIDLPDLSYPGFKSSDANWPSAASDYFLSGQKIYYRGSSSNWEQSVADSENPIASIGTGGEYDWIDTSGIINSAPYFLTYTQNYSDSSEDTGVKTIIFKNGKTQSEVEAFSNEQYYISDDGNGSSGLSASGNECFVCYSGEDDSFATTSKFYLYRYAGDSVEGPIKHYAVTNLKITDGFGQEHNFIFDYDLDSVACDTSGEVFKYYNATVYPGCTDITNYPSGYFTNEYINGLKPSDASNNTDFYYDMLDGNILSSKAYDSCDNLVASKSYSWSVYKSKALYPGSCETENLYGGFVCQTSQSIMKDSITQTTQLNYEEPESGRPYSGQQISSTKENYNSDGAKEVITSTSIYGYEKYPSLNIRHMLTNKVQKIEEITPENEETMVKNATATVLKKWETIKDGNRSEVPAMAASFHFLGGGNSPIFPYSEYNLGDIPKGWSQRDIISERTDYGHIMETISAKELSHSVIFDADQKLKVAQFTKPSSGDYQCRYLGFESYENSSNWQIGTETVLISNDSCCGTTSLELKTNGTLETSILLSNAEEDYLLGFYLKTEESFASSDIAGWNINISNSSESNSYFHKFDATKGIWQYYTIPILLDNTQFKGGGSDIAIDFSAFNNTEYQVKIDNVHINPIHSKMKVVTYNSKLLNELSIMTDGGKITRYIHDNYANKVIQTNNSGNVDNLTCDYLSRQGNYSDIFNTEDPNCILSVHPASGGICETFSKGDEWQKHWQASNVDSNWEISNGILKHKVNENDTMTLIDYIQSDDDSVSPNLGLYCEIKAFDTINNTVGLIIGDGYQVEWNPSLTAWTFQKDGAILMDPLVTPIGMARKWIAFLMDRTILFYGDGQLIFSYTSNQNIENQIQFFTGSSILGFRNLTILRDPQINAIFTDGTGKPYQEHNFINADSIIKQTIYDQLGRHIALTKPAPASFGNSDNKKTMQYRSTFVDVQNFLSNLDTTAVMNGDVSDYYMGQQDGANIRSNDQGFSYHRMRYNSSPLKRIVEVGLPGADHAIQNTDTTNSDDRQTVQIDYNGVNQIFLNDSESISGSYYTTTIIEPLKGKHVQIKDLDGKSIGTLKMSSESSDDTAPLTCTLSKTMYTANGKINISKLPNYFDNESGEDKTGFIQESVSNRLGELVKACDANTGSTINIYDSAGNLRFTRSEQDDSIEDPYILYNKYDSLNRKIESGKYSYEWNSNSEKTLRQYANNADWPNGDTGNNISITTEVSVRNYYDGPGNNPNSIGKLTSTLTYNYIDNVKSLVAEHYTYNKLGNVIKKVTSIKTAGFDEKNYTVATSYNNSNQVSRIKYPVINNDDDPITLQYAYDELGHMTGIENSGINNNIFASYLYDSADNIIQSYMNNRSIQGVFNYTSPGWHETLDYTGLSQEGFSFSQTYKYDMDGKIRSIDTDLPEPDEQKQFSESYEYDDLKRLKQYILSSNDTVEKELKFCQYDSNGNLYSVQEDENALNYSYNPGSDQLSSITNNTGETNSIEHYPSGEISKSPKPHTTEDEVLKYSYDRGLKRTSLIENESTSEKTQFLYGCQGKRAAKLSSNGSYVFYIHGNNQDPLVEIDSDGTACYYIYGPMGLTAFIKDDIYFPINDHKGSIRSVLDKSGNIIASYNYLPYGDLYNSYGDTSVSRYLYTGQEYDSETGLYNYHARLYNTALKRFSSQDSAGQFPSPYIYVGNNPVMNTDPSGNISKGAQIGIAVGSAVLMITATVVATVITLGTADSVLVPTEAMIGAAEGAAEGGKKTLKKAGRIGVKALINGGIGAVTAGGIDAISQGADNEGGFDWKQFGMATGLGCFAGMFFNFYGDSTISTRKIGIAFSKWLALTGASSFVLFTIGAANNNDQTEQDNQSQDNSSRSSSNPSPSSVQNTQMQHRPVKSAHIRKHLHGGHKKINMLQN